MNDNEDGNQAAGFSSTFGPVSPFLLSVRAYVLEAQVCLSKASPDVALATRQTSTIDPSVAAGSDANPKT